MRDQRTSTPDSGDEHRFYLAVNTSPQAEEARQAISDSLPAGWILVDTPERATAILTVDVDIDAAIIKQSGPALRVIGTVGPLVDGAAAESGVKVVELPEIGRISYMLVAEYVVTLILALTRNVLAIARTVTADPRVPGRDTPTLTRQDFYVYNWTGLQGSGFLFGKTVGIVGVGRIGSAVARMLRPFGVRLLYTQRHRFDEEEERRSGLEWREFDDLIRESDVVTLHHRFQEGPGGNEYQFGAREFSMMKSTAILVNTARGRLIDEDALVEALRRREIAGVGLDVFRYEPPPQDHPLLSLVGDNVILSPHIAAASESEYWDYLLAIMFHAREPAEG